MESSMSEWSTITDFDSEGDSLADLNEDTEPEDGDKHFPMDDSDTNIVRHEQSHVEQDESAPSGDLTFVLRRRSACPPWSRRASTVSGMGGIEEVYKKCMKVRQVLVKMSSVKCQMLMLIQDLGDI